MSDFNNVLNHTPRHEVRGVSSFGLQVYTVERAKPPTFSSPSLEIGR